MNWEPFWGSFSDFSSKGHTAGTACCACGGGNKARFIDLNQSRQEPSHHRLGKGGQTSPLSISKYFSEIFSPSHIKLTNKTQIWTLNRSSDRKELENFELDREIFSS